MALTHTAGRVRLCDRRRRLWTVFFWPEVRAVNPGTDFLEKNSPPQQPKTSRTDASAIPGFHMCVLTNRAH